MSCHIKRIKIGALSLLNCIYEGVSYFFYNSEQRSLFANLATNNAQDGILVSQCIRTCIVIIVNVTAHLPCIMLKALLNDASIFFYLSCMAIYAFTQWLWNGVKLKSWCTIASSSDSKKWKYRQLRDRRALMLFNYVLLRTWRALSP